MLTATDSGKTYFYILGVFWSRVTPKPAMFRIAYDASNPWGIAGDAEVYHYATRSWEACGGGRIPDWMDDFTDASLIAFFDTFPSSIAATDAFPGYRYIALGVTNSFHVNGFNGHQDVIAYVLSNDLVNWTPQSVIHSELSYFADGTSYNASVIDPILLEDPGGTLHLYFASADGDADHGITRDGVHDCAVDPNFGPTAIYVGSGIYESVVQPGELAPTDVTITPLAAISGAGQSAGFSIRVLASDGSLPSGGVSVDSDEWHMTTTIQNGAALVAIPFHRPGTHNVTVSFGTYGPWLNSYSFTTQNVGVPTHKRPGGK